ncbi:Retrovirus-related Pol polyprotein from transposon TNT 1-94 [Senna tora]|uniref:Retrovirus-related Pol polyprotein from transposon TNT 1-94 n=1 Tax=Senna tora TaxID=362788 RepID=A0A834WKB9_9FABA|nr:Retrovirus-related Pol polyprotein from transposon TNT 1-94 [Senna tora]
MKDDEVVQGAFFAKQKGKQGSGSSKKGYVDKGGKNKNGKNTDKKEKFQPCSICQREIHLGKDCWYKGKGSIQCRFYKKMGHIDKNYRKKQGCSYDGVVWLVDNGCTSQMCKEDKVCCDLDKSVQIKVTLGNGEVMQSQGKGFVTVSTRQCTKTIHNVLYVLGLVQNLLSVAQMISNGYAIVFNKRMFLIYDLEGKLLEEVEMVNKTFPLM